MSPPGICRGVFLPPFNDWADPHRLVELAVQAEEAGWDGFFLWDHVLRRDDWEVADPWIALAAIATATQRIRIGTMVTPIVRRRPQVLARQVVTLDHLSRGRVILGLGLGVDSSGELTRFGEVVDQAERAAILDEGADLLARLMSSDRVEHRGRHFVADGVRFLPAPLQESRVPMWFGVRGTASGSQLSPRAVRRAAKYDGVFLIDAVEADLARLAAIVASARDVHHPDAFAVAVLGANGISPSVAHAGGASWWMTQIGPEAPAVEVSALVSAGPPA